jgi:hypothetical protein
MSIRIRKEMLRGKNPNSIKQLADHAAAKKKSSKPVKTISVGLTEEAIASAASAASSLGISRSELVERSLLTLQLINNLQQRHHLTIRTPFEAGEPYFASATQLGFTGWNGKPDYEASGTTLDEAVKNLAKAIGSMSGNESVKNQRR